MEMVSFSSIWFGREGPKLLKNHLHSPKTRTPGLQNAGTSPGPMEFPEPTGSIEPPTQSKFWRGSLRVGWKGFAGQPTCQPKKTTNINESSKLAAAVNSAKYWVSLAALPRIAFFWQSYFLQSICRSQKCQSPSPSFDRFTAYSGRTWCSFHSNPHLQVFSSTRPQLTQLPCPDRLSIWERRNSDQTLEHIVAWQCLSWSIFTVFWSFF